jgi:hypothetical protein
MLRKGLQVFDSSAITLQWYAAGGSTRINCEHNFLGDVNRSRQHTRPAAHRVKTVNCAISVSCQFRK